MNKRESIAIRDVRWAPVDGSAPLADAPHPLEPVDVKRAEDALQNDPFVRAHPEWIAAIKQLLGMKVRAEQQALAKYGLDYVTDTYLPEKLGPLGLM